METRNHQSEISRWPYLECGAPEPLMHVLISQLAAVAVRKTVKRLFEQLGPADSEVKLLQNDQYNLLLIDKFQDFLAYRVRVYARLGDLPTGQETSSRKC